METEEMQQEAVEVGTVTSDHSLFYLLFTLCGSSEGNEADQGGEGMDPCICLQQQFPTSPLGSSPNHQERGSLVPTTA